MLSYSQYSGTEVCMVMRIYENHTCRQLFLPFISAQCGIANRCIMLDDWLVLFVRLIETLMVSGRMSGGQSYTNDCTSVL